MKSLWIDRITRLDPNNIRWMW